MNDKEIDKFIKARTDRELLEFIAKFICELAKR